MTSLSFGEAVIAIMGVLTKSRNFKGWGAGHLRKNAIVGSDVEVESTVHYLGRT